MPVIKSGQNILPSRAESTRVAISMHRGFRGQFFHCYYVEFELNNLVQHKETTFR